MMYHRTQSLYLTIVIGGYAVSCAQAMDKLVPALSCCITMKTSDFVARWCGGSEARLLYANKFTNPPSGTFGIITGHLDKNLLHASTSYDVSLPIDVFCFIR